MGRVHTTGDARQAGKLIRSVESGPAMTGPDCSDYGFRISEAESIRDAIAALSRMLMSAARF